MARRCWSCMTSIRHRNGRRHARDARPTGRVCREFEPIVKRIGGAHCAPPNRHKLERLPHPEIGHASAERVLAVELAREVPMQLEAEELERQSVAEGCFAVDELSVLTEAEWLSGERRGAYVGEEIATNAGEGDTGEREHIDEREAELEIRERGLAADDRTERSEEHTS